MARRRARAASRPLDLRFALLAMVVPLGVERVSGDRGDGMNPLFARMTDSAIAPPARW
jgi:hypothetical protein